MKDTTRKRKKAIRGFEAAYGRQELIDQMYHLFARGRQGFDACMKDLGSRMMQRWLASVLLYCEKGFHRVKGFASIGEVMATIDREHADNVAVLVAAGW